MLRTHRSLEAYCATLWWRYLCRRFVSFVYPCRGALVKCNWHGRTEVLGGGSCPRPTLSTTNPTWTVPGSNPGLRGERPATNRPSDDTTYSALIALRVYYIFRFFKILFTYLYRKGHAVAQMVQTLRYKPEGRGFDSLGRTMALRSTQPQTEMSTSISLER
jgi:hypothetical protein